MDPEEWKIKLTGTKMSCFLHRRMACIKLIQRNTKRNKEQFGLSRDSKVLKKMLKSRNCLSGIGQKIWISYHMAWILKIPKDAHTLSTMLHLVKESKSSVLQQTVLMFHNICNISIVSNQMSSTRKHMKQSMA